jgi:phosphatidylglycerol:prolipoprotein diacylglycerol transferase
MLQELFRIPGTNFSIHGYGLMLVIGFLLAMQVGKFLARRSRIDPEVFVNAGLLALLTGVIGARLSHVLENFSQYTDPNRSVLANLKDAVNVTSGGLTYYGGFLLATPSLIAYALYKKVPLRTGMDIIAPCLMVGLGIGRIGCFLNGCCYGTESNVPWAVRFPYYSNTYVEQYQKKEIQPAGELLYSSPAGAQLKDPELAKREGLQRLMAAERSKVHPVHPAQLYSTFTALLLAALFVAYYSLPHVPGHVFALMCMLEGATRFLLEMLRVEPGVGPTIGGMSLSLSMWIGVGLVMTGVVLWVGFGRAGGLNQGGEMVAAAVA